MPELPEVEVMRLYFEAAALKNEIIDVELYDKKILKGDLDSFKSTFVKTRFTSTERVGKYLFATNNKKKSCILHFGMTGGLELTTKSADRPRFSRMSFVFQNKERLHVNSIRKFGYVQEVESIAHFIAGKSIGPDALSLKKNDFVALCSGRKSKIKPFLMSQKNLAGIGNWIADELLHRQEIHPEEPLLNLDPDKLKSLHAELLKILRAAIKRNTNYSNFPSKWFVNQRQAGGHCTRCSAEVSKKEIGGRSSYFCASCQQLS